MIVGDKKGIGGQLEPTSLGSSPKDLGLHLNPQPNGLKVAHQTGDLERDDSRGSKFRKPFPALSPHFNFSAVTA